MTGFHEKSDLGIIIPQIQDSEFHYITDAYCSDYFLLLSAKCRQNNYRGKVAHLTCMKVVING